MNQQKLHNDTSGTRGYLVDVFSRTHNRRTQFCGVGRLETGESFGILDRRFSPRLYLRKSDSKAAATILGRVAYNIDEPSLSTMDGEAVVRCSIPNNVDRSRICERLRESGVRTYEGDVDFAFSYLIEHGIQGTVLLKGEWRKSNSVDRAYVDPVIVPVDHKPDLTILSFDIETNADATQVYGVSLVAFSLGKSRVRKKVLVLGKPSPNDAKHVECCVNERDLLSRFVEMVRRYDPDVISGWNVQDFDVPVLARRCQQQGVPFAIGRSQDEVQLRDTRARGKGITVRGRKLLDAMLLMRWGHYRFENFKLNTVAREILGHGKTFEATEEDNVPEVIERMLRENRKAFCEYCLRDSVLVMELLKKERLLELTINRSLLTGVPMDRAWGSVAPFEFLYMSELHRRSRVGPSRGVDVQPGGGAPGGLVMQPETGLYRHIFVFDFKSLYPSIIRTFNIDPLSLVQARVQATDHGVVTTANGARFSREQAILPGILDRFFKSREKAKKEGNSVASYAYKIIMNSFYGVLGTDACRFASNQLAGAITESGHLLLRWVKKFLESQGYRVLYGDTDSVFVDAYLPKDVAPKKAMATGKQIGAQCNKALREYVKKEYGLVSRLDLEFEKYYGYLLLPPSRGAESGRAKSYAGRQWIGKDWETHIVGMEAVRTDWTVLARTLQKDLLRMLFDEVPSDEALTFLNALIEGLFQGKRDAELVYRKNIRKPLSEYTKSLPPHVKAARMLPKPGRAVKYQITVDGPQPLGHVAAPLDYQHYFEKQVLPIVEMLASFLGIPENAFDARRNFRQTSLF